MISTSTLKAALRAVMGSLHTHGLRDHSVALWREGYRFGERRRRSVDDDLVRLRLLGGKAVLLRGEEATRFFYTESALRRGSAVPPPIARSLFGSGAVHGLDEGQRRRKALFTDVLDAAAAQEIGETVARRWDAVVDWTAGRIEVFPALACVLFRTGSDWSGLSADPREVDRRTADMLAMIDGFGSFGPRHLRAHRARSRTDAWVTGLVRQARRRGASLSPTILERFARHHDDDGERLPARVAAVEVINLVRPLVAVTWLVTMAGLALERWPAWRTALLDGEVEPLEFAQEVRRYYPFVPVLAARPAEDTAWRGQRIDAGTLVVLDVWGTNHDPRSWREPFGFEPTRFRDEPATPYNLIPQGGGSREAGHRCPGEDVTLAVLTRLIPRLAQARLIAPAGTTVGLRRMPPDVPALLLAAGAR